jgi:hypothetical protein
MDEQIIKQIVDELLSTLEPLETQSAALLQFLKAKGLATDEELAPFLEQAGNASNVRWRAVRVRTAALISNALKPAEKSAEAPAAKTTPAAPESAPAPNQETHQETDSKKEVSTQEEKEDQKKEDQKENQSKDSKKSSKLESDSAPPPQAGAGSKRTGSKTDNAAATPSHKDEDTQAANSVKPDATGKSNATGKKEAA